MTFKEVHKYRLQAIYTIFKYITDKFLIIYNMKQIIDKSPVSILECLDNILIIRKVTKPPLHSFLG